MDASARERWVAGLVLLVICALAWSTYATKDEAAVGSSARDALVFAWCGAAGSPAEAHARAVFELASEPKAFVADLLKGQADAQDALDQGRDVFTTIIAPPHHKAQVKLLRRAGISDELLDRVECINVRSSSSAEEARTPPELRDEQGMPPSLEVKSAG